MERFTLHYDRHKEMRGFSGEAYVLLSNVGACFLLTLNFLGGFIIQDAISTNRYFIHFTRDIH